MPKLKFTKEEVDAYLKTLPYIPIYQNNVYSIPLENIEREKFNPLHPYFLDCVMIAEDMKVHADGFFPYKLIKERRPNETPEVVLYREKIWVAKTKPTFTKVLNSLQKIRRSADWVIKYSDTWGNDFSRVRPEETLEQYCEHEFPFLDP